MYVVSKPAATIVVPGPKVSVAVPSLLITTIPDSVAVKLPEPPPGALCVIVMVIVSVPVQAPTQLKAKLPIGETNGVNGAVWLMTPGNVRGTEPDTTPEVENVTEVASANDGNSNNSAASRITFLVMTIAPEKPVPTSPLSFQQLT